MEPILQPSDTSAPSSLWDRVRGSPVRRLALIATVWFAALGLTLALAPYVQRAMFVFFWGPVLLAAWLAGTAVAAGTALLSVVAVQYFLVPPVHSFGTFRADHVLTFGIFVIVSSLVSMLATSLARAESQRAALLAELTRHAEQLQLQAVELEHQTEEAQMLAEEAEEARERAEDANRAKSQFLTVMSHELRTPLNAIGGYAQLAEMGLRGPVSDELRTDLERIQRSQRHLLGLVNDMLNLNRLERGSIAFHIRDVELAPVLAEAGELVAPQARARSLDYVCLPVPARMRAHADAEKVRQIVVNLLSNAVKFTPPGGRVELRAAPCDGRVHIEVRDTGPGIPDDKREIIFDPFVQLDRSFTRPVEGTGLGLSISRDLARAMHGELHVGGAVGHGSVFTLVLPGPRDTYGD